MIAEPKTENHTYHLLSQEEKVSFGLDIASFNSRMKQRLTKVRHLKSENDEQINIQNTSENTRQ